MNRKLNRSGFVCDQGYPLYFLQANRTGTPPHTIMNKHVIDTERLSIRTLVDSDAEFYLALLQDPGYKTNIGDRQVETTDDALASMRERVYSGYEANGFGMYLVELKTGGPPVGMAGLVSREFLDFADLGYAFLPAGRGQGLATEASVGILEHARRDLGLSCVAAITAPDNQASIRVLERLGFHPSGEVQFPDDGDLCAYFLRDL
jgi:RimJ/RimL family protein N-acetyltransferase